MTAIKTVAALSLALKYPTLVRAAMRLTIADRAGLGAAPLHQRFVASPPATVADSVAYKNVLAVSLATDYDFEASAALKERLANPEAFASAAPVADAPAAAAEAYVAALSCCTDSAVLRLPPRRRRRRNRTTTCMSICSSTGS